MEAKGAANASSASSSTPQTSSISSKYEVIKEIGKGSFGKVHQIRRLADGKILVWKEINYGSMSEREKQLLVSEVNILRELRHPNITRYYDRVIDKDRAKLYIVMEFCAGGDLAGMIRTRKKQLRDSRNQDVTAYVPEEQAWRIISQLTLALLECHMRKEGNKILHRDLKPGNVFFDADQNVKLGDFGLSRIMGDESVFAYTHVGTPYYMSPEQIQEQRYNEKSDIWSAGCVIYEMLSLRAPFEATNQIQLAYKIKLGKIERIPSHYSDEIFHVVQSMIALDPNRRPSVKNLMKHPRISFVIRQLEVKRKEADVLRKQNDVATLEQTFKERCDAYEAKMAQMEAKQAKLRQLEKQLQRREDQLKQRAVDASGPLQSGRSPKFSSQPQMPQQQKTTTTTPGRIENSTDRAINRLLDQQMSSSTTPSQEENDQRVMNINFRMDRKSYEAGGYYTTQPSSSEKDAYQTTATTTSTASNQTKSAMPAAIHGSGQTTNIVGASITPGPLAMKRNSYQTQQESSQGAGSREFATDHQDTGVGEQENDHYPDTYSSLGNFSSVVVQTPNQSAKPKEMPANKNSTLMTQQSQLVSPQGSIVTTQSASQEQEESKQQKPQGLVQGGGLLSGIEMQRQKLQELKRGMNMATSTTNQSSRGLSSKMASGYIETEGEQSIQSVQRLMTQESVVNCASKQSSQGRYSNLDYSKKESPLARHGRYGSSAVDNYSKPGQQKSGPAQGYMGQRQRSNSANKLGGTSAMSSGYAGNSSSGQIRQGMPANAYISKLRSQSRERLQELGRTNSSSRISGSGVTTPVVSQQKKPLPVSVHNTSSHQFGRQQTQQFQTPKQALAGMIKRNTSTGRGSGSRNRYEAQNNSQNPTTYLTSQRSQTAIPQHPCTTTSQSSIGGRISSQHKYQQPGGGNNNSAQQFGSRRASANQTQQILPRSNTTTLANQAKAVTGSQPANRFGKQPTVTQAAARAAQNYAMASHQQRRTSNSRLSNHQQSSKERLQHNFGATTNLAMNGRGGRVSSRPGSRDGSLGNRAGSIGQRAGSGSRQGHHSGNTASAGMLRQNSNGRPGTATAGGPPGRGGQKDLRNALEEITQRIQSKYLQV